MIRIKIFSEKVMPGGRFAICYHRTHNSDLISIRKNKGFLPGQAGGSMYGDGFYFTYEYESQLNDHMEKFGENIVKARVPLYGFLIFDKEVAQDVYGKDYDIPNQLNLITKPYIEILGGISTLGAKEVYQKDYDMDERNDLKKLKNAIVAINSFRFPKGEIIFKTTEGNQAYKVPLKATLNDFDEIELISADSIKIEIPIKTIKQIFLHKKKVKVGFEDYSIKEQKYSDYSSELAHSFFQTYYDYPWYKDIKGLMYTGRQDGKCLVAYDYHKIVPLAVEAPDKIGYYPKDNFAAFDKIFRELFTSEELNFIYTPGKESSPITDISEYIWNAESYKDTAIIYGRRKENSPAGIFSPERTLELGSYFNKLEFQREDIFTLLSVYTRFRYMKEKGRMEEFSKEYSYLHDEGNESIRYIQDIVKVINNFMKKPYMVIIDIIGEWEPIDNETLKHFVKQGIKKA